MTKQQLLKKLHQLVWEDDDLMGQDNLFAMQEIIDNEIVKEVNDGRMSAKQHQNGFIYDIKIVKEGKA